MGCCPSGFGCGNLNGQTCIVHATATTINTVTCSRGRTEGFEWATVPNSAVSAINLFAPMVQIVWREEDRQSIMRDVGLGSEVTGFIGGTGKGTAAGSPGAAATGIGAGGAAGGKSGDGGLSSGAIAGIAIGAALVILGVIVAALFVWRKKRKQGYQPHKLPSSDGDYGRSDSGSPYTNSTGTMAWPATALPPGMDVKYYYVEKPAAELRGSQQIVHEAPPKDTQPHELAS